MRLSYIFVGNKQPRGGPHHRLLNFAWDTNPGGDAVTQYNLYSGTSPGTYTKSTNAGLATTASLGVPSVTTYYAVKAQNASGESAASNELHYP